MLTAKKVNVGGCIEHFLGAHFAAWPSLGRLGNLDREIDLVQFRVAAPDSLIAHFAC